MATQAKVTSTEALETFRASLIIFLAKARRSVDDAADEVRRVRQWVQHDQRTHWEGEYRRRAKKLEQAQQELMSAKLGAGANQQSAMMSRQMAVAKAQRDLADAEAKLRKLKGWSQNFDSAADPVVKRMDRLRQTLGDLPKAIAYLVALQNVLAAYTDSGGPVTMPTSGPSSLSEGESAPGETAPAEAAPETAPPETTTPETAPTEATLAPGPAPQEQA